MNPKFTNITLLLALFFAASLHAKDLPKNGLIGWWNFDDKENLAIADVGTPLKITGPYSFAGGRGFKNDFAVSFDKGSHFTATIGDQRLNDYSLVMGMYLSTEAEDKTLVQFSSNKNAKNSRILIDKEGFIGSEELGFSQLPLPRHAWYTIVVSVSLDNFVHIYIDGILYLKGKVPTKNSSYTINNQLQVFADPQGEESRKVINYLAIYNRPLSENESFIEDLFTDAPQITTTELMSNLGFSQSSISHIYSKVYTTGVLKMKFQGNSNTELKFELLQTSSNKKMTEKVEYINAGNGLHKLFFGVPINGDYQLKVFGRSNSNTDFSYLTTYSVHSGGSYYNLEAIGEWYEKKPIKVEDKFYSYGFKLEDLPFKTSRIDVDYNLKFQMKIPKNVVVEPYFEGNILHFGSIYIANDILYVDAYCEKPGIHKFFLNVVDRAAYYKENKTPLETIWTLDVNIEKGISKNDLEDLLLSQARIPNEEDYVKILAYDYETIDEAMKNIPEADGRTMGTVCKYIKKQAKNELEEVRAAFIWITTNMKYGLDRWGGSHCDDLFRTRGGVCHNYAQLMDGFCRVLEIKSLYAGGEDRGSGGHAWNIVSVDGVWWPLDPTAALWLSFPADMLFTYLPWPLPGTKLALLDPAITLEDYEDKLVKGDYSPLGKYENLEEVMLQMEQRAMLLRKIQFSKRSKELSFSRANSTLEYAGIKLEPNETKQFEFKAQANMSVWAEFVNTEDRTNMIEALQVFAEAKETSLGTYQLTIKNPGKGNYWLRFRANPKDSNWHPGDLMLFIKAE